MKILLTGITGFLGSYIAKALVACGHEVLGVKRQQSSLSRLVEISDQVSCINADRALELIYKHHSDVDIIIHTATAYGNKFESSSDVIAANLVLPLQLLEFAIKQAGCAFINADTFFLKAEKSYSYLSSYIESKRFFLQAAQQLVDAKYNTFCNMQIEHMYGPDDGAQKFTTIIMRQMIENMPTIELTPGQQVRDFVFIDDVVNAFVRVVNEIEKKTLQGFCTYEVGSGVSHTLMEFVTLAHQIINSKSELLFGSLPYRPNEIMYSVANVDLLKSLGWRPQVKIENGIEALVKSMSHDER